MSDGVTANQRLRRLGGGDDAGIDLIEAAVLVSARTRPGVTGQPYRRHFRAIADAVATYAGAARARPSLELRREALAQVIGRHYGYRLQEDAAKDPDASDLLRVVDGRGGSAEALGLVHVITLGLVGWPAAALAFPTRPLVRLEDEGERMVIDPASAARVMTPQDLRAILKAEEGNQAELVPAHFEPMGARDLLVRLLRARKRAFLVRNRLDDALEVVETALMIAPGDAGLWRESGLLNARLDRVRDAVAALEEYLRHDAGEAARYNTSVLLQELRARLT